MTQTKEKRLANQIGSTLARIRAERGYTQEFLAERLDVTIETIGRFERGIVLPTLPRLYQLAEVLAVPVVDLLQSGSSRSGDVALEMTSLLERLSLDDQTFVRKWLWEMCEHLGKPRHSRKKVT
ncbi:helix-turn-helix transcriptional regulator [Paraburkholderia sp. UCT31]|uniref:helix-turn-helix domain-containing protein n=1 Tax=Paraburkholderia sp. UCT31 TaxID=2615209 RepID=UPI00165565C6|nr:helix-turn-helix transcriptional regulator [Paraburkholderia sp. UCT31]MBC8743001.1 helix-turn-helix transcriptional regulator [Paraburkholderia sp. UCT31]